MPGFPNWSCDVAVFPARASSDLKGNQMKNRTNPQRRRAVLIAGAAITSLTAAVAFASSASAATTAQFNRGHRVLTIFGDARGNAITVDLRAFPMGSGPSNPPNPPHCSQDSR